MELQIENYKDKHEYISENGIRSVVYLMDCMEGMKQIPDKSINAIICDLPYGTTKCRWDLIIPFDELWGEYKRIIAERGVIVLFGTEPFTSALIQSNVSWFREKLIWVKHKPSNFGNAKHMHLKYSEDIVVFSKGKRTYNPQMQPRSSSRVREAQKGNSRNWNTVKELTAEVSFSTQYEPRAWNVYDADFKYPSNVINIPSVVSNSKEKANHPTQKPVALLDYLIKTYSNVGDSILDNTMGSGTTGIAAMGLGRSFIGFELDSDYFNASVKRFEQHTNQTRLF